MPDFDAFWGSRDKAVELWDDHNRAVDVATLIQDHPTSVAFKRGSTEMSAQTVFVTRKSTAASDVSGPAASVAEADLVLFGVQNHATLDDLDVQRGDVFKLWGTVWRVDLVVEHLPGVIEAHCEGQQ